MSDMSNEEIEKEFRRAVREFKGHGSGREFMEVLLDAKVLTGTKSIFEFSRQVYLCSGIGVERMRKIIQEEFSNA